MTNREMQVPIRREQWAQAGPPTTSVLTQVTIHTALGPSSHTCQFFYLSLKSHQQPPALTLDGQEANHKHFVKDKTLLRQVLTPVPAGYNPLAIRSCVNPNFSTR